MAAKPHVYVLPRAVERSKSDYHAATGTELRSHSVTDLLAAQR